MCAGVLAATILLLATFGAAAQETEPPPYVSAQIEDLTLHVDDRLYRIDLADYFGGAHPECFAVSSDESVAVALIAGFQLRIYAVGPGTTTVTASVTDPRGFASQTFRVTVTNEPPELGDALPDATVRVGESIAVDLSDAFSTPAVSYSAESSPATAAETSVDGSTLTLTGREARRRDRVGDGDQQRGLRGNEFRTDRPRCSPSDRRSA